MKARRICVYLWMVAALTGSMPAAGQLPTHIVIGRGDDAWSGRLHAMQFLPTPGTLDAPSPPNLWEASRLLDAVSPEARRLWTFHRSDSHGRTPVRLQWATLSPAQQAAIDLNDEIATKRIDYLAGGRRHEHDDSGLRPRTSVLGAMRGARAQLLGPPGVTLDPRHAPFRRAHARRPWMIYIGANDGMLHGFDALTGVERFAVMPDAVLPAAARNASSGQPVPGPICSRPFVTDAWTGAQWRSLLACANGAMGSGLFLVDVTDPTSFTPPLMLAYDASDDPTVGRVEGPISIVQLADGRDGQRRSFAISGNGQSDGDVESRLLLLALDQPGTTQTIRVHPAASRGGLGAPAVALNPQGTATFVYAADSHGQIWRFDLSGAPPWPQALGNNDTEQRTPFFKATSRSGSIQRILGPMLLAATSGGPLLVFATADTEGRATLYGVVDTNLAVRNLSRDNLATLSASEGADGVVIRPEGSSKANGWHIDLPAGQIPSDLTTAGQNSLLLTTRDATGRERAYLLDAHTGLPASKESRTGQVVIGAPLVTVQSTPPALTPSGAAVQAIHTSLWQRDGQRIRQLESRTHTRQLGRLSWREMTEAGAR